MSSLASAPTITTCRSENPIPEQANDQLKCLDCGYPLRGLAESRCPECGRTFDPSDPDSMWHPDRVSFRPINWSGPPPRSANRVFTSLSLLILLGSSEPVNYNFGWVVFFLYPALPIMLPILCVWAGKVHTCYMEGLFREQSKAGNTSFVSAKWLLIPLCTVLCLSTFTDRPWTMLLRFRASHSSFEQAVKDHNAGTFRADRWVGLYHVDHVIVESGMPGGRHFLFVTGSSAFDPIGFEYDSQSALPTGGTRQQVAPGWYTFAD